MIRNESVSEGPGQKDQRCSWFGQGIYNSILRHLEDLFFSYIVIEFGDMNTIRKQNINLKQSHNSGKLRF